MRSRSCAVQTGSCFTSVPLFHPRWPLALAQRDTHVNPRCRNRDETGLGASQTSCEAASLPFRHGPRVRTRDLLSRNVTKTLAQRLTTPTVVTSMHARATSSMVPCSEEQPRWPLATSPPLRQRRSVLPARQRVGGPLRLMRGQMTPRWLLRCTFGQVGGLLVAHCAPPSGGGSAGSNPAGGAHLSAAQTPV